MKNILIISASVRKGRKSHRVVQYFQQYLVSNNTAAVTLADLAEYQFPVFEERLQYLENPPEGLRAFAHQVTKADGVIIVTPEYNGGYPASLKNAVDALYDEWYHKPVGIATVSSGSFGGSQVITSLQFVLWKMKAWVVPAMFPVPNVGISFSEDGTPADVEATNKRAAAFIKELMWAVERAKLSTGGSAMPGMPGTEAL